MHTPSDGAGAAGLLSGGGGNGGNGNNGSSYNNKQPTGSSERPGSQGVSPSHYASLHTHGGGGGGPSSGGTGSGGGAAAAAAPSAALGHPPQGGLSAAAWLGPSVSAGAAAAPHPHTPHSHLVGSAPGVPPPGLPAGFQNMFTAPFGEQRMPGGDGL